MYGKYIAILTVLLIVATAIELNKRFAMNDNNDEIVDNDSHEYELVPYVAPVYFELYHKRFPGCPIPYLRKSNGMIFEQDFDLESDENNNMGPVNSPSMTLEEFEGIFEKVSNLWPKAIPLDDKHTLSKERYMVSEELYTLFALSGIWDSVAIKIWRSDMGETKKDFSHIVNFAMFSVAWQTGQTKNLRSLLNDENLKMQVLDYLRNQENHAWIQ